MYVDGRLHIAGGAGESGSRAAQQDAEDVGSDHVVLHHLLAAVLLAGIGQVHLLPARHRRLLSTADGGRTMAGARMADHARAVAG